VSNSTSRTIGRTTARARKAGFLAVTLVIRFRFARAHECKIQESANPQGVFKCRRVGARSSLAGISLWQRRLRSRAAVPGSTPGNGGRKARQGWTCTARQHSRRRLSLARAAPAARARPPLGPPRARAMRRCRCGRQAWRWWRRAAASRTSMPRLQAMDAQGRCRALSINAG
jgi:hypothetical protein